MAISGTTEDGIHVEIKFHQNFQLALENLFHVNLTELPPWLFAEPWNFKNCFSKLEALRPTEGAIYSYFKGKITSHIVGSEEPLLTFPLKFLIKQGKVFLIKEISENKKC